MINEIVSTVYSTQEEGIYYSSTVEPVLKDHPTGHEYVVPSRQIVSGARLNIGPSDHADTCDRHAQSFKTSGLMWCLKTGFTVYHFYLVV